MTKVCLCVLAIACANPVFADELKLEASAQAVAPYLDEQTLAIAHVDVTRLDVEAILSALRESGNLDVEDVAFMKARLAPWVADFTHARAKDLYVVFSLADYPRTPFFIIPLTEHTSGDVLVRLFRGQTTTDLWKLLLPSAGPPDSIEQLDRAVFAGSSKALARIKSLTPVDRPEVAKAFAAVRDSAAQVLIVPTATSRRVMEELVPNLPKELGGGPPTVVTAGMLWAAIAGDFPPALALRVVVQSKDVAAARALKDAIDAGVEHLSRVPIIREAIPGYEKLVPLLKPTIADDRLVLNFAANSPELKGLLAAVTAKMGQSTDRRQCANNLHMLGIALHTYHDTYRHFPAVANFDKEGRPLLSWRVHLLPFLAQDNLYKQFHLDEPWDSEHNKKLIEHMPDVFRCPSMKRKLVGKTTYLAPVGDALMFTGTKEGVRISDIVDGTANTIFVVDADDDHAVIWTKPEDLRIQPESPSTGLHGHHAGGCNVLFADASVHFVPKTVDPKALWAIFTRNGGEVVNIP
jgi:prepilin-type processing-associated H-X9-DG protein